MADLVWSDPDPEKEDFAISPRCVRARPCTRTALRSPNTDTSVVCLPGARDTLLVRVSCTSFWRLTRCRTSSARISCVWRAIRPSSTSTCPPSGLRQTTVTAAETRRVSWRSVQVARCTSTSSRPRPKTSGTAQAIRPRRVREGRYVPVALPIARALAHPLPLVPRTSSCVRSCRSTSCNIRDGRTIPLAAQTAATLDHNCILGSYGPARPA